MTLVRLHNPYEDKKKSFPNAASAIETPSGVIVEFENQHKRYGDSHHFTSYHLIATGR